MATNNPFANKNLDRAKLVPCVQSFTGNSVRYEKSGDCFHLHATVAGKPFKMAIYEKKDGATTLSLLNGQDKSTFESIAAELVAKCAVAAESRLEVSLTKVTVDKVESLLGYLKTCDIKSFTEETKVHHKQFRFVGKQGDTLTVNSFTTTGTLQLQGKHALLASYAMDFLTTVLDYKEAIDLQIKGFSVKSSAETILHELAGQLPRAIGQLGRTVQAQLASALALTKSEIPLMDYGAIAFPALRGLEGMLKSELSKAGFDLTRVRDFGEYFEAKVVGQYVMRADHAALAKQPKATELASCYTVYQRQRHTVAHMDSNPETSRVLASMSEAKTVVTCVFDTIEQFFKKTYP